MLGEKVEQREGLWECLGRGARDFKEVSQVDLTEGDIEERLEGNNEGAKRTRRERVFQKKRLSQRLQPGIGGVWGESRPSKEASAVGCGAGRQEAS